MEFRILGPLEVVGGDGVPLRLGSVRERALLGLFVLHANEVLSTDRIVDELWPGDPPDTAAKIVQVYVSHVRRALGSARELLETRPPGYVLRLPAGATDVERCEQLVAKAADEKAETRARVLRDALAVWRDAPLSDLAHESFAAQDIVRLAEWRLGIVEERIAADIETGQHLQVAPEIAALVRAHPLRERLRGLQMLALYRSGRQAEALDAFQDARRALSDELGLEPSRELRELQQRVLRQDRALDLPLDQAVTTDAAHSAFVGRERELGVLVGSLEDVLNGHGRLALIAGEPGIGKSRLAEELARRARARGLRVVVGRCWEAGGAPAYWPWVQSLRAHIRATDTPALLQQLGTDAAVLAQLLPELGEIVPSLPPPPASDSEGARFRLFEAVSSFLRRASRDTPLLVVIDDLHAADEPSLLMLRFVAREITDTRLLLCGAYRDVDPTLRDPLASALSELAREPHTRQLSLGGLSELDVAEYINVSTSVEMSAARVEEIYAETDGNPLFVGEIVRLLDGEGTIGDPRSPLQIPAGVRSVIKLRVARLSAQCQELLVPASVLGREFDLDALAQLAERGRDDVLDVLDEAIGERIVANVRGSPGRFRFGHALMRDVLYDGLTSARRLQLHLHAATSLEAVYGDDLEPHVAELAHHYFEAAALGETDKARDYATRAGGRAVTQLAFEEAVRLYDAALLLADSDVGRCRLLLAIGDALARAGDSAASKRAFRRAADLAESEHRSDYLAEAALGYGGRIVWEVSRDDEFLVPLLERALAALGGEDSALKVRLLARLGGGPLRDLIYPPERRKMLGEESVNMARRIGDPATLAWGLIGYISAHHSPAFTPEQVDLTTEAIDAAMQAGDLERAVEAYDDRQWARLELGDGPGARADLAATARLAARLRQPSQDWCVAQARAHHALLEGRLAEAEDLINDSIDLGRRAQRWNAVQSFRLQLYDLRRQQGRLAEIDDLVRSSVDEYPTYRIWRCVAAQVTAELGLEAESRGILDALALEEFAAIPFDELWLVSMGLLAEAAASVEHVGVAAPLYGLLLPYANRVAVATPEISIGSIARYLGLLASTMRRWESAAGHFDDATAMNQRIGARPWLAHTRRDFARMLLRHGEPADAARAQDLFEAAVAAYRELGMESHALAVAPAGSPLP